MPKPFLTERIRLSTEEPLHILWTSHYGAPTGIPILFLHGGPGGQSHPENVLKWNVFDMHRFRLVFFDQRGCGRSTPRNETRSNTPQDTIEDVEHLRKYYSFPKIILYGQSYGTALALLYVQTYPKHMMGCILHGVFLCESVFPTSLLNKHPRLWKQLRRVTNTSTLAGASVEVCRTIQTTHATRKRSSYVDAWCALEDSELRGPATRTSSRRSKETLALFESYYNANQFFGCGTRLTKALHRLKRVPTLVMHGEHDYICPIQNAKTLQPFLGAHSTFVCIPGGKHQLQPRRRPSTINIITAFLELVCSGA